MSTNLDQILSQQTTTCHCSLVTPDKISPGTRTHRVIAHIITNELDPGEQYYAVPMDSQTIDMVLPSSPTDEAVKAMLSHSGYDMTSTWRLMSWHIPETDGIQDAF